MDTDTQAFHPNDIRQKFLTFFAEKEHLIYPSASLRSEDPHLLFSVAGMQQFKPYFQGATPVFAGYEGIWQRVSTSQKCMRAGGKDSDIENVGRTLRHHTLFEMMGNFSFGDYFKAGIIPWAWEFLTSEQWLGLDPERLYVTVYTDDDEAYLLWRDTVGVPETRIGRFGQAENYWPANAIADQRVGPCGPCSEIFYDRGPAYGSKDETGPNTGSGDRFIEIWNLVFMQYNLSEEGELTSLPQQNIDTGLGLERITSVLNDVPDAYSTALFQPTIKHLASLTGVPYEGSQSVAHRIIADHIRGVTFAIADGILPANDGAGYVIKMLIRRALKQAYSLGVYEPVLYKLVDDVVTAMGEAYPELISAKAQVQGIIKNEEQQFLQTLASGIERVDQLLEQLEGDVLPGDVAFDLWQTYGFPLDMTAELAQERGVRIDREGYDKAREVAREASRADKGKGALFAGDQDDVFAQIAQTHGETEFIGYEALNGTARVLALIQGGSLVPYADEGQEVDIVLDTTPFYGESGGQIGDAGTLDWPGEEHGGRAIISTTSKNKHGVFIHHGKVATGRLSTESNLHATVDLRRAETEKHHSATHLLHAALQEVLGDHVTQAGSLVEPTRLRFDFTHNQALSDKDIETIEVLCNRWIQADFPVTYEYMPLEQARKTGAMMLFGEKYGEIVRVVSMGEGDTYPTTELCGGTHVKRTGRIGQLSIITEESVSSGVRRIEAVTGEAATLHTQELRAHLSAIAQQLSTQPKVITERINKLQQELKEAQRERASLRDKLATTQTSTSDTLEVAGFRYATAHLDSLDAGALRHAADSLLQKSDADLVVVASGSMLVVKVTDTAQSRGIRAGQLAKSIAQKAGGSGGGRPDMAQAGLKDPARIPEALDALPEVLSAVTAS